MSIPALPAQGSTAWYQWAQGVQSYLGLLDTSTFADASYGNGQGGIVGPAITTAFGKLTLDTANSNVGGYFDTANSWYTVPVTGLYLSIAKVRLTDSVGTSGANLGLGVDGTVADGPHFVWQSIPSATRKTFDYQRLALFTAGTHLQLYAYYDGGNVTMAAASLNVVRLG